ncbi:16463_t:CDS:1, partial [Entrophospora sp. SA101]
RIDVKIYTIIQTENVPSSVVFQNSLKLVWKFRNDLGNGSEFQKTALVPGEDN